MGPPVPTLVAAIGAYSVLVSTIIIINSPIQSTDTGPVRKRWPYIIYERYLHYLYGKYFLMKYTRRIYFIPTNLRGIRSNFDVVTQIQRTLKYNTI